MKSSPVLFGRLVILGGGVLVLVALIASVAPGSDRPLPELALRYGLGLAAAVAVLVLSRAAGGRLAERWGKDRAKGQEWGLTLALTLVLLAVMAGDDLWKRLVPGQAPAASSSTR